MGSSSTPLVLLRRFAAVEGATRRPPLTTLPLPTSLSTTSSVLLRRRRPLPGVGVASSLSVSSASGARRFRTTAAATTSSSSPPRRHKGFGEDGRRSWGKGGEVPLSLLMGAALLSPVGVVAGIHRAEAEGGGGGGGASSLEEGWDDFMDRSIRPGEEDEDEEDEEEEDDDDEEEEEDEAAADETAEQPPSNAVAAAEVDDPYLNLPEKDEPTTCTICLINRQGPCRPHWRPFERCMKDHSDNSKKEGGAEKKDDDSILSGPSLGERCDGYMLPWLTCIQKHRNTYTLITNALYQKEYVDVAESAVMEECTKDFGKLDVDWSGWTEYRRLMAEAAKEAKEGELMGLSDEEVENDLVEAAARTDGNDDDAGEVSAERRDEDEVEALADENDDDAPEPILIEVKVSIPIFDSGDTDLPVEVAYARDQEGTVLGFEQFGSLKRKLKEEEEERKRKGASAEGDVGESSTTSDDDDTSDDRTKEDATDEATAPAYGTMYFHLLPGVTETVRVYALYKDEDDEDVKETEAASSTTKPEHRLYQSRTYALDDLVIPPPSSEEDNDVSASTSVDVPAAAER